MDEGNLSRMRASIVNEKSLSLVASQLLINEHLILGTGEMTSGGSQRDSILANTLEAILGAVFVDGGYDSVENIILKILYLLIQLTLNQITKIVKVNYKNCYNNSKKIYLNIN